MIFSFPLGQWFEILLSIIPDGFFFLVLWMLVDIRLVNIYIYIYIYIYTHTHTSIRAKPWWLPKFMYTDFFRQPHHCPYREMLQHHFFSPKIDNVHLKQFLEAKTLIKARTKEEDLYFYVWSYTPNFLLKSFWYRIFAKLRKSYQFEIYIGLGYVFVKKYRLPNNNKTHYTMAEATSHWIF